MFVLDGNVANLLLVAAKTDAGVSIFAVDPSDAGVTRTNLATMDQTRKQSKIEFAGAPATLIGTDGAGWTTLERVLDLAAVALAAEQVGGAQKVLETAVQYAKDRVQFGRPIGSFQAIKHKCADMLLEVESAKSAAYYAAWCAAELNDELPSVASLAKAYCSEAYFHAAAENIQIHGGIGFTWEHPAHLYFKRAKSLRAALRRPDLPPRAPRPAHRHLAQRTHCDAGRPAGRPSASVPQLVVLAQRFGVREPQAGACEVTLASRWSSHLGSLCHDHRLGSDGREQAWRHRPHPSASPRPCPWSGVRRRG